MEENKKQVSIELTDEQYAFLTSWQKTHEQELGIEVPLTAMVRKAIDGAMKAQAARSDRSERPPRPERGAPRRDDRPSRPSGRFGDKPGGRSGFGSRPAGRPSMGRGPKFDMLPSRGKSEKKFD